MPENQSGQASDRWSIARYGAAAVAATAGLTAATPVQAAIVYTDPEPNVVATAGDPAPPATPLNMDNAGPAEFTFSAFGASEGSLTGIQGTASGNAVAATVKPFGKPIPFVNPLAANTPIPGSQDFLETALFSVDIEGDEVIPDFSINPWADPAFAGLTFLLGPNTHFGWAQFQVGEANGLPTVTLFDYAYCDEPNRSINAGQTEGECGAPVGVPEPSSLLLLATGAVAVGTLRRLRRLRRCTDAA
jgi:hypothetical protein